MLVGNFLFDPLPGTEKGVVQVVVFFDPQQKVPKGQQT